MKRFLLFDLFSSVYSLYADGFRSMTTGRVLWKLILVKLFVIFAVFKLFFFQDFMASRFDSDADKAGYVMEQISLPASRDVNNKINNKEIFAYD